MVPPVLSHLGILLGTTPPPFIFIHAVYASYALKLISSALLPSATSGQKDDAPLALAVLNCVECFSPQIVYSRILCDLRAALGLGADEEGPTGAGWDAFVDALRRVHFDAERRKQDGTAVSKNLVLLFSHAERLRDNLPALLVLLTRLAELARIPITTIFLSCHPWTSLRPSFGASPDPFALMFPSPTKVETIVYLESLFPITEKTAMDVHHYNPTLRPLYGLYVDTLCQSCWFTLKDPQELAYLAATRWPGFVSPLLQDWKALGGKQQSGEGDKDDDLEVEENTPESYPLPNEMERMRLIKMFTQSFIPSATVLHPRLDHAYSFTRRNPTPNTVRLSVPFSTTYLKDIRVPGTGEDLRDLGRNQKLLIVAAYVCGVNPAKSDSRLFVRVDDSINGGRKKRRKGNRMTKPGAVGKVPQRLLGPGPASLDRVLAVLGYIITELDGQDVAEEIVWSSRTLNTVAEMTEARLLHRTSAGEKLEGATMFKCAVDAEVVQKLGKDVGVSLSELLWDPES